MDAAYPIMRGFLAPYRRVLPHNKQEAVNNRRSSSKKCDRVIFWCVEGKVSHFEADGGSILFEIQRSIVVAVMTVHNFIRK